MSANPQNLKRFTSEEARINGRKGAIASAEARRRYKTIRETLKAISDAPVTSEKIKNSLLRNGLEEGEATNGAAVGMAITIGAMKGNPHLVRIYLEMLGELDAKKVEVSGDLNIQGNPFKELTVEELRKLAERE